MRPDFLLEVIKKYASKTDTILEIGCGKREALNLCIKNGYLVTGIDKDESTSIQDYPETEYDIIYTMSTLFLIADESVFLKIARMVKKYIITIEGEVSRPMSGVIGRDYSKIFVPLGFEQVEHQENVFNEYGHLRVFKKI